MFHYILFMILFAPLLTGCATLSKIFKPSATSTPAETNSATPSTSTDHPNVSQTTQTLFGFVKVFYNNREVTSETEITFSQSKPMRLTSGGFTIVHATAQNSENIKIETLVIEDIRGGLTFPNLVIKAAASPTIKTYFGHLTIQIVTIPALGEAPPEVAWNWEVKNQEKEARTHWENDFKNSADPLKTNLAQRIGPQKSLTRKIVLQRQQNVVHGL